MPFQPGAKLAYRLDVGAAGIGVPDLSREKLRKTVCSAVACRYDQRGSRLIR